MRISVIVVLVFLVTMAASYENRNRRRRTTTIATSTSTQAVFDEVNVVKFNGDRWRGEEEDGEEEDVDDSNDLEDFDEIVKESTFNSPFDDEEINTNDWLTNAFDEVMKEDFGRDRNMNSIFGNDMTMNSIFNSESPASIFVNSNSDFSNGPNMCHKRHVERQRGNRNHNHIFVSSCTFINGKFNCNQRTTQDGVTTVVHNTWACCEGFDKDPTQKGCPIVKKETNLECMQYANMTDLIAAFTTFDFNEYLTGDNKNTIIAPSQNALQEYEKHLGQKNENVLEITPEMVAEADLIKDRLLTHILPTTISITEFKDVMKVQSALNNSNLFFYKHSHASRLLKDLDVTVNCKVLQPTYMNSNNGRVYPLEGFLTPLKKTFKQILEEHSEAKQFLELIKDIELSDIIAAGRTILIPTDKAFESLNEWALEKLKKNAIDVVKSLSGMKPLCPHQFDNVGTIKSIDGSTINISKNENVIKFNTAVLEGEEVISNEGTIVYFIDGFLNLDFLPPTELVRKLGASKFAEVMTNSSFQDDRDTEFSLVVPSNEAMQELEESDEAVKIIQFHTIVSPIESDRFLETEDVDNKVYHTSHYNTVKKERMHFMQCVPVKEHKTPIGYTIFTADKILPKAERTLIEVIANDPKFSIFRQFLASTKLDEVFSNMDKQFTLLAVENKVFEALEENQLAYLKRDDEYMRRLLKNHIIPQVFCLGDSSNSLMANLPTVGGYKVRWMTRRGETTVAGKVVKREESNRVALDGVLHVVDGLIIKSHFIFVFYE